MQTKIAEIKKQLKADKGNQSLKDQLAQAKADLNMTREANRVVSAWINPLMIAEKALAINLRTLRFQQPP